MLALGVLTLLLCLAHALASPWDALISTGEGVVLVATPSTADAAIQEWIRRDLMRDLGGDGIALLTPEDHAAISAIRPDAALSKPTVEYAASYSTSGWWIGYNDVASEGSFVWSNGSSSTYTNWSSGQPDNGAGTEDCAHMQGGFGAYWNDDQCWNQAYYICESGN